MIGQFTRVNAAGGIWCDGLLGSSHVRQHRAMRTGYARSHKPEGRALYCQPTRVSTSPVTSKRSDVCCELLSLQLVREASIPNVRLHGLCCCGAQTDGGVR